MIETMLLSATGVTETCSSRSSGEPVGLRDPLEVLLGAAGDLMGVDQRRDGLDRAQRVDRG